ncbi:MAG: hypothetical protein KDA91_13335 [Planctomycetaceae bacterium]|nr:hypothetical protein [Planctomycetaceae bacterium]
MFNRVRSFSHATTDSSLYGPEFDAAQLPVELREMYENWAQSEDAGAFMNDAVAESDWPITIFVPQRYEECYAYPLIIWLHSDDTDEDQLEDVMEAISPQNYVGLSLRGNHFERRTGGYRWNMESAHFGNVPLPELLHVTTCRMRKAFHIHSERIFLAGSGSGADAALQLLVHKSEWFAGAILLDPIGKPDSIRGERLTGICSKAILQTQSRAANPEQLARNLEAVRLLRSAGARVKVELTDTAIDPTGDNMRFLDHWIMNQLNGTALV